MRVKDNKLIPRTYIERQAIKNYGRDAHQLASPHKSFVKGYELAAKKYQIRITELEEKLAKHNEADIEIKELVNDIEGLVDNLKNK